MIAPFDEKVQWSDDKIMRRFAVIRTSCEAVGGSEGENEETEFRVGVCSVRTGHA